MVIREVRTVDGLGRIILPTAFKMALGLEKGDKVNLRIVGNLVVLHKMTAHPEEEYQGIEVDELGRVLIPKELLEKMGWKIGDKIGVQPFGDDMLAFRLEK